MRNAREAIGTQFDAASGVRQCDSDPPHHRLVFVSAAKAAKAGKLAMLDGSHGALSSIVSTAQKRDTNELWKLYSARLPDVYQSDQLSSFLSDDSLVASDARSSCHAATKMAA